MFLEHMTAPRRAPAQPQSKSEGILGRRPPHAPAASSSDSYSSGVTGNGGPASGSAPGSTGKISVTSSPPGARWRAQASAHARRACGGSAHLFGAIRHGARQEERGGDGSGRAGAGAARRVRDRRHALTKRRQRAFRVDRRFHARQRTAGMCVVTCRRASRHLPGSQECVVIAVGHGGARAAGGTRCGADRGGRGAGALQAMSLKQQPALQRVGTAAHAPCACATATECPAPPRQRCQHGPHPRSNGPSGCW
jgi:hypothetical protein